MPALGRIGQKSTISSNSLWYLPYNGSKFVIILSLIKCDSPISLKFSTFHYFTTTSFEDTYSQSIKITHKNSYKMRHNSRNAQTLHIIVFPLTIWDISVLSFWIWKIKILNQKSRLLCDVKFQIANICVCYCKIYFHNLLICSCKYFFVVLFRPYIVFETDLILMLHVSRNIITGTFKIAFCENRFCFIYSHHKKILFVP